MTLNHRAPTPRKFHDADNERVPNMSNLNSTTSDSDTHIDMMRYINHHTSFLPITTSLKPQEIAPKVKGPYAVYHPRNVGTIPPNVQTKSNAYTAHSAGCRMKNIAAPVFKPLPFEEDDIVSHPTVITARKGHIAIGDTAGFVTIYTSLPTFAPLIKLNTAAGQRSEETPKLHYSKRKKKIGRSNVIVNSSVDRTNAVEAVALLDDAVVISTYSETECIDFEGGRQRWIWTDGYYGWDGVENKNMLRGFPLRLDADEQNALVLASFGFEPVRGKLAESMEEQGTLNIRPEFYSPLLMIDAKTGKISNIGPKDKGGGEPLEIGPRAMAMFCKRNQGQIFGNFIVYNNGNSTQELMILDSNHQILHRTEVPSKLSGTKFLAAEVINQSPKGTYSITGTTKGGIRVYRTSDLSFIGAYGEGVSLHGHHLVWQHVFFVKFDKDVQEHEETWGQIVEREDELQHREWYTTTRKANQEEKEDNLQNMYIVSVPDAFREPVDMKDTIHFWDMTTLEFDGGNKMPSFTITVPQKSEGICSLLYDDNMMASHSGRLIVSTHSGECLQLVPTLTTDWAGQMYPKGYIVIDNNVTYIEDEDELDMVVDSHLNSGEFCQPTAVDDDIKLALQISTADEIIDVVGINEKEWRKPFIDVIAPKVVSKAISEEEDETKMISDTVEGGAPTGLFDFQQVFPQAQLISQFWSQQEDNEIKRRELIIETEKKIAEEIVSPVNPPKRKMNNIEQLINASVDKKLMVELLTSMGPSDGSKSRLAPDWKGHGTKADCAACAGRSVIHKCGKRNRPIDYDSLARDEKQKQERKEAEKRKVREEKRKQTELKRKEAKRKKKEEEEEEARRQRQSEDQMQINQQLPVVTDIGTEKRFHGTAVGETGLAFHTVPVPSAPLYQARSTSVASHYPIEYDIQYGANSSDTWWKNNNYESSAVINDQHYPRTLHEGPQVQNEFSNSMMNHHGVFLNIPTLPSEPSSTHQSYSMQMNENEIKKH